MENCEYWQGVSSKSLVQRFGKNASQTQDCTVKQTAGEKRKIAEFVRVHEVAEYSPTINICVFCTCMSYKTVSQSQLITFNRHPVVFVVVDFFVFTASRSTDRC